MKYLFSVLSFLLFGSMLFSINLAGSSFREEVKIFDENGVHILSVRYFDYKDLLAGQNLTDYIEERHEIIGLLEIVKINDEYFDSLKRNFFEFYYYYSSIEGNVRDDFKNERKETNFKYTTFRQNDVDFGGKNDCGDCGTPLSSGYGQGYFENNVFGIADDNIIYVLNKAVNRDEPHSLKLDLEFEGQFVEISVDVK